VPPTNILKSSNEEIASSLYLHYAMTLWRHSNKRTCNK